MRDQHHGRGDAGGAQQRMQVGDQSAAVVGCATGSLRLGASPTGVPGRS